MPVYKWSQTAASNATADPAINYQEGQAPSSINDSGRAEMAVLKMYVDDISGAILTGGTSTAYTVASYSTFDTLAHMSGSIIAFTPHATNGATVTLNVDGLGAKPLRSAPSVELVAGILIQGSPYVALYNNSDAAWYLQNFFVNPYNVPLSAGMDYWGPTAPNSAFAFPIGQAISRTTYATLFALISTTYGTGDGSTTFNLPDKTGRVSAMKEATATRLTTAGGGVDGGTLGSAAGAQNKSVSQANLPSGVTLTGTAAGQALPTINADISGPIGANAYLLQSNHIGSPTSAAGFFGNGGSTSSSSCSVSLGGSGTALQIVQPTIICNYIMRII